MIGTGLPTPADAAIRPAPAYPQPSMAMRPPTTGAVNIGGAMTMQSLSSMQAEAKRTSDQTLQEQQAQPVIIGLAGHIKNFFTQAEAAKLTVQTEMLDALYARRGEYTAAKAAEIKAQGQPAIFMMLGATKMRQAESLLRDVLIGAGTDKPWTLHPGPMPELPPFEVAQIRESVTQELEQAFQMGLEPSLEDVRNRLQAAKDELTERIRDQAMAQCQTAEDKMETQLNEGGFTEALDEFITDLTTFKTAYIVGPIVRNKPYLTWDNNSQPVVQNKLCLEWERADPFDMYPAPWAKNLNDKTPFIRKHKLSRDALQEMRGVEGYSDDAIVKVLELYGLGGLNNWLSIDSQRAVAEGKNTLAATTDTGLIDALQFWGSVSGQMLRDWGMTIKEVPDVTKEYQVEAWLVGSIVIKAVLNADPLARRPIYGDSYERIPGSVWGNSVYDLMKDCQDMCNAAARSLAANLGIASGPQVGVNVSRMPANEDVTNIYPWKIWQFEEDPMGNTAPPIIFFQPQSNAEELMNVYSKFSVLADEYTGIPKYMTGSEGTPGAGRTASGLSMMIGNASKIIKQVVGSVDAHVLQPLLERLYYYNMRYSDDADLKGALRIVARGAMSLTTKDAAQVRRNEFLQATNNPVDMQIIGLDGRAEVLRSAVKTLDMNPDKIVPPVAVLKQRAAQQQIANQQAMAQENAQQAGAVPPAGAAPGGPTPNNQNLANGAPTTDTFQPATQGA